MVESKTPPPAPPEGSLHGEWASRERRLAHDRSLKSAFSGRAVILLAIAVLVLMAAGALSGLLMRGGYHTVSQPGSLKGQSGLAKAHVTIPGNQPSTPIKASNAELMGLTKLQGKVAPGFTLTDQHGQTVSLAALERSHAVVLGFMDDECHDICPIVAQELVDAYHDLGARAGSVDFVAVNVNSAHAAVATLRSFMAERGHGIATMPDFYYVTGPRSSLAPIWAHYKIKVIAKPTGGVVHSDALYFIAPGGREVYEATPFANLRPNGTGWLPAPTITQWGSGIAQYAAAAAK